MRLDLKELLREDGVKPFSCRLEPDDLEFPSISRFRSPLRAEGRVTASAGLLELTGSVCVQLDCICDRCGVVYSRDLALPLDTTLADEHEDPEDPDVFLLEDGGVELDEIVCTAFVLGLESKLLCRPDCKGVCPRCGKNLNDGPCACRPEGDPRLAALQDAFDALQAGPLTQDQ